MATQLKILIVENSPSDIELYEDAIYNLNGELEAEETSLIPIIVSTLEDAKHQLLEEGWSAAFIDLKLSSEDILAANEGNELVDSIFEKLRFPIVVLSNTPQEVDPRFRESESLLLKVHEKSGASYEELIRNSVQLCRTGIVDILGGKGLINNFLVEIFWQHISRTLPYWIDQGDLEPHVLERTILRYTLSHLNEHLKRNKFGSFESHHPSEFYIYPPINTEIFTGDIIEYKDEVYVVLNPACDMVIRNYIEYKNSGANPVRKSKTILLCKALSLEAALGKAPVSPEGDRLTGNAKKHVQNKVPRYHFLPPYLTLGGLLLDFQQVSNIPFDDENHPVKMIATVSSPFLKDLIARFSFYYSRQGAPDIKYSLIESHYLN